jgi:SAM-dependent methyltransferase
MSNSQRARLGETPVSEAEINTNIGRYVGEQGCEYFYQQVKTGKHIALWNSFLWESHIAENDDVLDFGCGGGFLLSALPARKKVGVEVNPAAIEVAQDLGIEVVSSLDQLPPQSFSKAISSHALEHVTNPFDTLREIRRALIPGGQLYLLLPLDDWRSRHQRASRIDDPDMHLYAWTPRSLGNLLVTAGYSLRFIRVISHAYSPVAPELLWSLSPSIFHSVAWLTSVLLRRRQLFACAEV